MRGPCRALVEGLMGWGRCSELSKAKDGLVVLVAVDLLRGLVLSGWFFEEDVAAAAAEEEEDG